MSIPDQICAFAAEKLKASDTLTFALVIWVRGQADRPASVSLSTPPEDLGEACTALVTTARTVGGPAAAEVALRGERLQHVAELIQGAEDPDGEQFRSLAAWALSPRMINDGDRAIVLAHFEGREQAGIDEGHVDEGTDARAIAVRLVARLEGGANG